MRAEALVRRLAAALLVTVSVAGAGWSQPAAAQQIVRQWWITPKDTANANLRVMLESRNGDSTRIDESTHSVPYATLRGLTAADLAASPGGQRQFEIVEDPGKLVFQGFVGNGKGNGTYDLVADPAFQRQLARRGMRAATDVELTELALHHFKVSTIDDAAGIGLEALTPADLVTMVDHGISPDYLRGFKDVPLAPKTMSALARLRDHGVSADFVRAFAAAGYRPLSVDDVATARDHGVRASLLAALARSASYRTMTASDIATLSDHGVSGAYVSDLDRIAYHPPVADLVRLHDHGVSAAFIQRLRAHGYGEMSVSDIIKLYEHGI